MITKLASEILNGALTKAGVYNVDFLTKLTMTNALNDSYRSAYQSIATSDSDFYVREYIFSEDDVSEFQDDDGYTWYDIPSDVYIVKSVSSRGNELTRCPPKERVPGTYTIQNGRFKFYGSTNSRITLKYIPNPQTITVPAPSIELTLDPKTVTEWGLVTKDGFYYKTNAGNYFYSFDTNEKQNSSIFKARNNNYHGGYLTFDSAAQTIYVLDDDENILEDYTEDFEVGSDNPVVDVVVDDPYMMLSYADGTVVLVTENNETIWNIKAYTGHKTKGTVVGLKTDDSTLYGCLYIDEDGVLYHSSFVPDTIMNYPTNALFTMLEVELACLIMNMNGVQNDYIQGTLKEETIKEFRDELRQNRASPVRVANLRRNTIVRR